jgi:C4-dicarboxylate transporter, DctM subunit
MGQTEYGLIGVGVMLVLFCLGAQIGFVLLLVGFVGYGLIGGFSGALNNLSVIPYNNMNSYYFAVIPLFLLMAEFIGQSGIGADFYKTARSFLGQFRGGLAMATIGACGLFAAVSGSSLAGTVVMSRVAYPEMKRNGYQDTLSTGVIAAGGTLGILIPPSMAFVLIGILADLSIGKLFLAGIIPGIVSISCYILIIFIMCKMNPALAPGIVKTTWKEKGSSLILTWPVVVLFVVLMGGIYTGVMTATEAAGIGAFGALIIALVKRRMSGVTLWQCMMESSKMTGMIIIMVVGAFMFNGFLAITQLPNAIGEWMVGLSVPTWVIMVVVVIFYLICGMFFDIYAILIVTIPILYPAVEAMGFNLIWYSVIMVVLVEVGFISPPFGINLFVLCGIIKIPIGTIYRGSIAFCISNLILVIILIIFPSISTFIPSLM